VTHESLTAKTNISVTHCGKWTVNEEKLAI